MKTPQFVTCQITKKQIKFHDAMPVAVIRPGILELIKKSNPDLSIEGFISKDALKKFREEYIQSVLADEGRELNTLDKEVIQSMVDHENMTKDINSEFAETQTVGNKLSDGVARVGGSWKFIIAFGIILAIWIAINSYFLLAVPFDPYPYILLNLCLSCVAAIQAPIIMMSQNRKDAKDRLRGEHDYKVNLKAELEIRHLHEKMDHLLQHQWQRMMEIQELQLDIMEGLGAKKEPSTREQNSSNHANHNHANHSGNHDNHNNHDSANHKNNKNGLDKNQTNKEIKTAKEATAEKSSDKTIANSAEKIEQKIE